MDVLWGFSNEEPDPCDMDEWELVQGNPGWDEYRYIGGDSEAKANHGDGYGAKALTEEEIKRIYCDDEEKVQQLVGMGFPEDRARAALRRTDNDVQRAAMLLAPPPPPPRRPVKSATKTGSKKTTYDGRGKLERKGTMTVEDWAKRKARRTADGKSRRGGARRRRRTKRRRRRRRRRTRHRVRGRVRRRKVTWRKRRRHHRRRRTRARRTRH